MPMGWTQRFRSHNQKTRHKQAESSKALRKIREIKGKTFWIDDPIAHEQLFDYPYRGAAKCCFNHMIGMPVKDGKEKPIFDYEMELFHYLEKGKEDERYKHIWLKKARGLGITEFLLRYMGFLALSSDQYRNTRFVIVTGPKQRIAEDLIRRMKNLYADYILEETRLDRLSLNGVTIEAFPSHTVSMRGYEDFKFILLDEADFFEQSEQEEVEAVARGYIVKTQPWIVLVSTPHEPNSLFHKIEQKKSDEEAGYIRLHYLYQRGIGKIYEEAFLEAEKEQDYFKREYEGQYSYGVGTLFSEQSILQCEKTGRELDARLLADTDKTISAGATRKSLGIDIGWGSSRTAFVLSEFIDNTIRIIRVEQYDRPDFDAMVKHTYNLIRGYGLDNGSNKVFIDGSAPSFIGAIKRSIGEDTEYLRLISLAKESETDPIYLMNIVPVNFSTKNQAMLDHAKRIVDKQRLAINPDTSQGHKDLLTDLRIAKNKPETMKLDKSPENKMDLFDALRLSLEYYQ